MSEVELRLTANLDDATKDVAGFRKEYAELVKAVEKPLRQVDALQKTQESAKQASTAFFEARKKVAGLQAALEKVSQPVVKLGQALALAKNELNGASGAVDRQKKKLEEQRVAVLASKQALDALKQAQAGVDVGGSDAGTAQAMANARQAVAKATAEYDKQRAALLAHQKTLAESRARVKALGDEHRAAGVPVQLLENELSKAQRALSSATREFDRQKTKVREQRAELRAAGVDTHNLAAEQKRLQAALSSSIGAGRNDAAVTGIRAQAAALAQATREQRLANIEAAKNNLGISQARSAGEAVKQLTRDYQLLRTSGNLTGKELVIAQQQLKTKINETKQSLRELAGEQQKSRSGSGGIGAAVGAAGAGYAAIEGLRAYVQITDSAKKMNAQLLLATGSQKEFNTAQADTYRIAQDTRAPLADVVTLYSRLTPALRAIGRGQGDVAGVTDALTKSLRISGATSEETSSALTQFAQSLSSGVLRGEEFNAVAESAPRLMQAMADGLGVPVGALRAMAADGKLTADVITDLALKALPQLTAEAAKLPDTVEGAFTRLKNDASKAFGGGDTSGLINAVTELSKLLKDPAIIQGLTDIAAGMATLAGWAVIAASEFSAFAKEVAYTAAATSGQVAELEKLEKTLAGVKAAQNHGNVIGRPTITFFMSPEDLARWSKELEDQIAATKAKIYGITVEQQTEQEAAAAASLELQTQTNQEREALNEALVSSERAYIGHLSTLRDQQVAAKEAQLKKEVAAEQRAAGEIDKIRKDRVAIEQEYGQAIAELKAGGRAGGPSYSNAQALKVGAQQALKSGDLEGAKAQAKSALKVLQDLAAAGESTYGFEGFARSLEAIALEANSAEEAIAVSKRESILAEIEQIKQATTALQNLPITLNLPPEEVERVKAQLQALAGTPIIIPVILGPTPEMQAMGLQQDTVNYPDIPALAGGGQLRGPGTGTSDSILMWGSNGEFMQPEAAVRYYGAEFMEDIRRMRVPKFATGGPIGGGAMPRVPSMNPGMAAALAPPQGRDLGRVSLNIGGETHSLLADADSFSRILQLERLKRGRS